MFHRNENSENTDSEETGLQADGELVSASEDVTWESVLTREDVDVPDAVSGNTEELVGAVISTQDEPPAPAPAPPAATTPPAVSEPVSAPTPAPAPAPAPALAPAAAAAPAEPAAPEEPYFGFEETVSVSEQSFPSSIPSGMEEPVQIETRSARHPKTTVLDEDEEVSHVSASNGEENTLVLRRSLLGLPEQEAVPAVGAVQQAAETVISEETLPVSSTAGAGSFEEVMTKKTEFTYSEDSVQPEVSSRALPRVLSVILSLLFVPIAWYLVADAAARLAFAPNNPMLTGVLNIAALGELLAGLIALVIVAILAAQSSLGLIITGVITIGVGVPFLVVPSIVQNTGYWGLSRLEDFNAFSSNVVNHFMATGFTGLFVAFGTIMLAFGIALGAARRSGRAEEYQRAVVAETNPAGLKARWARKATQKSSK